MECPHFQWDADILLSRLQFRKVGDVHERMAGLVGDGIREALSAAR